MNPKALIKIRSIKYNIGLELSVLLPMVPKKIAKIKKKKRIKVIEKNYNCYLPNSTLIKYVIQKMTNPNTSKPIVAEG